MKQFFLLSIIGLFIFGNSQSQILEIPYTGQDVTVTVSGSMYYIDDSPQSNDPLLGVMVLYVANGEDGSSWDGRLMKGTTYYKTNPDTLTFTSNSATQSLHIFVLELQESVSQNLGEYSVKVNGTEYILNSSNIVYLVPCNTVTSGIVSSVISETAQKMALHQNFPNPFNQSTSIDFFLDKSDNVRLTIYDSKGGMIKTLINKEMGAGQQNVVWYGDDNNGRLLSSGNYFYQISVGEKTFSKKMIILR